MQLRLSSNPKSSPQCRGMIPALGDNHLVLHFCIITFLNSGISFLWTKLKILDPDDLCSSPGRATNCLDSFCLSFTRCNRDNSGL